MVTRNITGSTDVFDRIKDIDSDFIDSIKKLFQKPEGRNDEEWPWNRNLRECPEESDNEHQKNINWPRDIGISDEISEETEKSLEDIEDRIWGRVKGMDPVTILGRNLFRWPWTYNDKIRRQDPATILGRSISRGSSKSGVNSSYVLYPYGTETGDYPSRFLGICVGKTSIDDVMEAALCHSAIIATKYRNNTEVTKTVIIVTDKWDQNRFNRTYEGQMIAHAVNDGIWYLFLFVNQFGIEQIPFLPNYRTCLHGITWKNLPEKDRKKYARRVLELCTISFKSTDHYTGQKKKYVISNLSNWRTDDGSEEGKIEKSKIGKIIDICYDWADNSFNGDGWFIQDLDNIYSGLKIFGKTIDLDWDWYHQKIKKKLERLLG